jgi:hypothetical protein
MLFCVVKGAKIATHKLTAASAKVLELEFIAAKVLISRDSVVLCSFKNHFVSFRRETIITGKGDKVALTCLRIRSGSS